MLYAQTPQRVGIMQAETILVAAIAGFPGVLVGIGSLRAASLKEISKKLDRLEDKLDRHILWHVEGT